MTTCDFKLIKLTIQQLIDRLKPDMEDDDISSSSITLYIKRWDTNSKPVIKKDVLQWYSLEINERQKRDERGRAVV